MTDWVPTLVSIQGPRYLAFVLALEADIASGRVKPGMRLLPQRDMAQRLDLSVGTISKAYAEAEQRGLISGEVGRGTFVQRRRPEARGHGTSDTTINLALNVPPYTGEDDVIASALSEIVADGEMSNLLGYLPHQGLRRHREAMATWLASLGMTADADHLLSQRRDSSYVAEVIAAWVSRYVETATPVATADASPAPRQVVASAPRPDYNAPGARCERPQRPSTLSSWEFSTAR